MNWFTFKSSTWLALSTIRAHKMRTFLTVLGVIIGTSTIIGVGSIIAGLDGAITDIIRSFGPNTLIVFKIRGTMRFGDLTPEERQRKPLTYENAMAIRERCPSVVHVSPYLFPSFDFRAANRAKYKGNEVYQIRFAGTTESYAFGGLVEMKYGRFFTDMESQHRMSVVVIGEDIQKTFFPNVDPVGKWIEVSGHQFEVVGSMVRPSVMLAAQDDLRVMIPYWTMRKMFPSSKEHMLVIVAEEGKLAQAMDEVHGVLRQERRVPQNKPDTFWISTAEQMVEDFRKTTSVVAIVMVVLSSIGLLVGGIGVMNIMLVSVTERTREIGIRKAVGARRADIVLQFLTEATVLTGAGGLVGIFIGWVIATVARLVFPALPTSVPVWAAVMGVVVSVGIGLFFGIWPANKAARLDPVDALRYE
jgi:putative ABC transport system permease protein